MNRSLKNILKKIKCSATLQTINCNIFWCPRSFDVPNTEDEKQEKNKNDIRFYLFFYKKKQIPPYFPQVAEDLRHRDCAPASLWTSAIIEHLLRSLVWEEGKMGHLSKGVAIGAFVAVLAGVLLQWPQIQQQYLKFSVQPSKQSSALQPSSQPIHQKHNDEHGQEIVSTDSHETLSCLMRMLTSTLSFRFCSRNWQVASYHVREQHRWGGDIVLVACHGQEGSRDYANSTWQSIQVEHLHCSLVLFMSTPSIHLVVLDRITFGFSASRARERYFEVLSSAKQAQTGSRCVKLSPRNSSTNTLRRTDLIGKTFFLGNLAATTFMEARTSAILKFFPPNLLNGSRTRTRYMNSPLIHSI